ncbi:sensor histidine kinase [Streptomyces sp. JB150]|nr:sensor histidine kinase [Streptomyces sp. JB150]
MTGPRTWWQGKSTPAKVETYTRWSFHFFAVIEAGLFGLPLLAVAGMPARGGLLALLCAHAALCALTGSRALDWVRGTRERPVRLMWALGAASALLASLCFALARQVSGDDAETALGTAAGGILVFGVGGITLGLRGRRPAALLVTGFSAGVAAVAVAFGAPLTGALASAIATLAGTGFFAFTSVFSVWLLNAVWELDAARETRARLAVAEERLRFGRDLHDVIGRNLAVIALKSELAVQLARRGREEAVAQMVEVQRIAAESQREVRDVVRGYREADLGVELLGAQGVLKAAGIDCEVTGGAAGLPAEVQSALGWVVREATTNVLRHGDARRCSVELVMAQGFVVLTVENDGAGASQTAAPAGTGRGGSGLAGLRERLRAVDGTLEAGFVGDGKRDGDGDRDGDRDRDGVFRVVARVPVAGDSVAGDSTAGGGVPGVADSVSGGGKPVVVDSASGGGESGVRVGVPGVGAGAFAGEAGGSVGRTGRPVREAGASARHGEDHGAGAEGFAARAEEASRAVGRGVVA